MASIVSTRGRVKVKIKKGLSIEQMANQLAQDFIAAIYSSVGNKVITDQRVGDWLDDVVEQSLDHSGMADEQTRLSATRIEANIALDVSGSMFNRWSGRAHVPAAFMVRLLHKAFRIVEAELPQSVFKFNIWLWAVSFGGRNCACLTAPEFGHFQINDCTDVKTVDAILEGLGRSEPYYAGSGTQLCPWLTCVRQWEEQYGDPTAHKLDIVVTDGLIHDNDVVNHEQNFRPGKLNSLLFVVSNDTNRNLLGFTSYNVNAFRLREVVADELLAFVQRIF